MMASYSNHAKVVELLLTKGANANTTTFFGMTALDFSESTEIVDLLIKHGQKPSCLGKQTPSMRDPTILCTRIVIRDTQELQDMEIKEKLREITCAFAPRPISNTTSDLSYYEPEAVPELRDAYRLFRDFAYNWEAIGALLNVESYVIKEIRYDRAGEAKVCFQELLGRWLKRVSPRPTWKELTEAVERATHGSFDITHKIKKATES